MKAIESFPIIPCDHPTSKKFKNFVGRKFNRLTVVEFAGKFPTKDGGYYYGWRCLCDCGATATVRGHSIISGNTKSCGCLKAESARRHPNFHGMKSTGEYGTWCAMNTRCTNPRQATWAYYGGRGIKVCDEWRDFRVFLAEMGPKPTPKHTLERRDNDGPYCKSNCYWATYGQQMRNTRRTRFLTFNGKTMCVTDWAEKMGFSRGMIDDRLKAGWTIERTLTTPKAG